MGDDVRVDRHARLPVDAAVRHDVHRRLHLRLLLDAARAQSPDGAALDRVAAWRLLPGSDRRHVARRCLLHPRHQRQVSAPSPSLHRAPARFPLVPESHGKS